MSSEKRNFQAITFERRRSRGDGFCAVPNDILQHPKLSYTARGLLGYFLSLPSDWKIIYAAVMRAGDMGEKALRKTVLELKTHGYARHVKLKDPKTGIFYGTRTEISDEPTWDEHGNRLDGTDGYA